MDSVATEALRLSADKLVGADGGLSAKAARQLACRLGAHADAPRGRCAFGFWLPQVMRFGVAPGDVVLELLRPIDTIDLTSAVQSVRFSRALIPLVVSRDFAWAVVEGLRAGDRTEMGDLYQVRFREAGIWNVSRDFLASSLPWGPFAPAEIYDVDKMQAARADLDYYKSIPGGGRRLSPPRNILEIHVGTATLSGTIAGLTRRLDEIAERIETGKELRPADECFMGYDAFQLMPLEPTIEMEAGPPCFQLMEQGNAAGDLPGTTAGRLRRPHTTNWGYDVVIAGAGTVNPALLETGRPDELVDLSSRLHRFPGRPIQLILDMVFGHCDNQALSLLNYNFFAGPNMYGQDLNFRHPMVRAILLEMQRRKLHFGADGLRIDGAQDFRYWDPDTEEIHHDDDFLAEMSQVEVRISGVEYLPWCIFEDGRPWPREDWELASTYRALIEKDPEALQWGPLTFAHNTPFLYTFWLNKWWRIEEILHHGENWVTGTANHDTVRRGTQVNPKLQINRELGSTLLEILDNAYDHPAATLLTYGFLPGIPMDFLNAAMHVPWGFVRNTDDFWGVKVVAEESTFLDWQVDAFSFAKSWHFRRLKDRGFDDIEQLRRFMFVLRATVDATNYDLDAMCRIIDASFSGHHATRELSPVILKSICRDYMDDLHAYCNVDYYGDDLSPRRTSYNLNLRKIRAARPWLRQNLGGCDVLKRRSPAGGAAFFYGVRTSPIDGEQILIAANLEGQPVTTCFRDLDLPGVQQSDWELMAHSPGLVVPPFDGIATIGSSHAVLYRARQKVFAER